MKFEKEYETSFSMTRNLFLLSPAHSLRKKISLSLRRSKYIAVGIGTNHTGKITLPANVSLATPVTT